MRITRSVPIVGFIINLRVSTFFLSEMYVLLHLALELTDLLLAQLVITRRELESSQYGPFTSDLSVDNQNRGENSRSNNSIDNSLQTESNRANDNPQNRRNTERERFSRSNRSDIPSTSAGIYRENAEDLLSAPGINRPYRMAEQLKRLFYNPRHTRVGMHSGNTSSNENQGSNTARCSNNGSSDDNNSTGNIRAEDNRQSASSSGLILSENALSAEVQSIVERIQSSSSINNDDRGEVRTIGENRGTSDVPRDNPRESQPRNESDSVARTRDYRRSRRNAVAFDSPIRINEPSLPENETQMPPTWTSLRRAVEQSSSNSLIELYRSLTESYPGIPLARTGPQFRDSLYRHPSLQRDGNIDFVPGTDNVCSWRRFLHREGTSSVRQEFNVPELQVNSIPLRDLNNIPPNARRRRISPPAREAHSLSPSIAQRLPSFGVDNRNNDRTNDLANQPGPSSTTLNNNRNRVQHTSLKAKVNSHYLKHFQVRYPDLNLELEI